MEDTKVVHATEKGNLWEGGYHLHIQCFAPTVLVAFMRKRHLNNDSTAYNSLYHLQKGPDRTNIQIIPLRHTNGGLRCNENDYIRKGTPLETAMDILQTERERTKDPIVKESASTVNEQSILRLA